MSMLSFNPRKRPTAGQVTLVVSKPPVLKSPFVTVTNLVIEHTQWRINGPHYVHTGCLEPSHFGRY